MTRSVIAIPARMASERLPGKPLADLLGKPMIAHVLARALEADIGPVIVACAEPEIAEAVRNAGCEAVLTDPAHPSGSDRIWEALGRFDPGSRFDTVVNVQGDLPTIEPTAIRASLTPLENAACDIATLVAEIVRDEERDNPNVVKVAVDFSGGATTGRALYFSRAAIPAGDGPLYHHIGLYAYRRRALGRFISLPPGGLEKREKLEQLRALEDGMRIDAALVDTVPLGVDTPADLARAADLLSTRKPT